MLEEEKNHESDAKSRGIKFQQKVAELYQILGAEVEENVMICNKKVDLLITFSVPGSRKQHHRIIVECKAEKYNKAQNQRVMEFSGLLNTARKSGEADSAEIITLKPWSEQAKGYARQTGVEVLTYEQKIRSLIDFKIYLQSSINLVSVVNNPNIKDPPLSSYYITPKGVTTSLRKRTTIDNLLTYLMAWANDSSDTKAVAIVGEYGVGKTSLCRMLCAKLSEKYLADPDNNRIPVLLSLREYTKTLKIESLINSFLDDVCEVANPRYKLFDAMNEAGMFLMLLDGFDEMASRTDSETIELNLSELEKLGFYPKSRMIITTRPEYFASDIEQAKALSPSGKETLLGTRTLDYYQIEMNLWEDAELREYLSRRTPSLLVGLPNLKDYKKAIDKIPGLSDLCRRPILAEMIVKTLPALVKSKKAVDKTSLYETYLLSELRRQKVEKRRRLLLSDEKRLYILEEFAGETYQDSSKKITFDDVRERIQQILSSPEDDLDALTRDFVSCSFLIRRHNEFIFSHKSFHEYLTAKSFYRELSEDKLKYFGKKQLDQFVLSFIMERGVEFQNHKDILMNWILRTRSYADIDQQYLGGNAVTVLCVTNKNALVGKDLSGTYLRRGDLRGANLSDTIFSEAFLDEVDLRGSNAASDLIYQARRLDIRLNLVFQISEQNLSKKIREYFSEILPGFFKSKSANEKLSFEIGHADEISFYDIVEPSVADRIGFIDCRIRNKSEVKKIVDTFLSSSSIRNAWFFEFKDQIPPNLSSSTITKLAESIAESSFKDRKV